jgi:hypothetical protein
LPVTLSAEAGPLYGMMLPNFISVSVMPGCSAEADVHTASDSKAARANLLSLIIFDPPGGPPILCYLLLAEG